MRVRPEEVVARLHSSRGEARTALLRQTKNEIIGNRKRKAEFIAAGAPKACAEALAEAEAEAGVLVQAAAAVGSFAASEAGLRAVVESGAVPQLLRALQSEDGRVVEAAVRSLKAVCKSLAAPREQVLEGGQPGLARLVALLREPDSNLAECAATVLAACCAGAEQQATVAAAGAVPPLVALLGSEAGRGKQEAALEALAALTEDNPTTSAAVLECPQVPRLLLGFLRPTCQPRPRYLACLCLANLSHYLPPGSPQNKQELQQAVLPVLVRLLVEAGVHEDVPGVLCQLVVESEELQKAATDVDAISKLAAFLRDDSCPPRLREGALRALSTLCADKEEHRRQLVECKVLPQLTAALSDEHPGVRAAACACVRSLSRSTRLLRGNIGEVEVAAPLLLLSGDADAGVALQATATLANIALEFSAVKHQLVSCGGVQHFASLAESMEPPLRLHGIWALSSVTFLSQPEVKDAVVQHVPWATVAALLGDPDLEVREKAMLLLQNMAFSSQQDIDRLMGWSSGEVLGAVRRAMDREDASQDLKKHALKVVSNVSSSSGPNKASVMAAGWPGVLAAHLADASPLIREAAVWAVINLTWRRDDGDEGLPERLQTFQQLGVDARLRAMQDDPSLQVRERAAHALEQFQEQQQREAAALVAQGGAPT